MLGGSFAGPLSTPICHRSAQKAHMRAQGSAFLTPEHTDMPQRCPEATQTCSGVSIFDSRAHSETTKGFNGKSGALIGTLEGEHLGWDLARQAAESNLAFLYAKTLESFERTLIGQLVGIVVLTEMAEEDVLQARMPETADG